MKHLKVFSLLQAVVLLAVTSFLPIMAEAAVSTVTPETVYEAVEASGILPDMVQAEEADLSSKYGVDVADLSGYAAAEAKSTLKADTVVIMKAKNPAARTRITEALETVLSERLEAVKTTSAKYKALKNGSVGTNGMYVYLIISEESEGIAEVIGNTLNPGASLSGGGTAGNTLSDDGCVGDGLVW